MRCSRRETEPEISRFEGNDKQCTTGEHLAPIEAAAPVHIALCDGTGLQRKAGPLMSHVTVMRFTCSKKYFSFPPCRLHLQPVWFPLGMKMGSRCKPGAIPVAVK
jgi:hypothetical protein